MVAKVVKEEKGEIEVEVVEVVEEVEVEAPLMLTQEKKLSIKIST